MQDSAHVEKAVQSLATQAPAKPEGEPEDPKAADNELPRKFGRLTLLKPIARGGMGEVMLATAGGIEGAERPCVVKIIRREHAEDSSFLARFFDEARIQAQLDHPGVARVLEASTDPSGKPFVVVEYIEGRNLAEVRNRGAQLRAAIAWPEAVAFGAALSEALTHVHERTDANGNPLGIVHRDLSPQNVMVGYGGDVKLIDFGTARGENRRCQTVSGVVLAKPGYVAPEVANNQAGGVPADLYALGIILWELVAGRRFLSGEAAVHVAEVAAGKRNPSPIAVLAGAPSELDIVIARLTAPRIEDRYASARDASTDLIRILKKAPSLANGERGVRVRIAQLMSRLYPAEPARSRAELGRLIAGARNVPPTPEPQVFAPSPPLPAVDESLFPGTRYRLGRELGRGAMGVVYEAHHVDLGRTVALKILPKERCQSAEHESRFRREARAIARIRHAGLVQLHDFGVSADGRPYYAMEMLEGETLEQYVARERGMDFREAARVGIETLAALEVAHGEGLVHRDIKPANLFLTSEGKVKLLDFGIVQMDAEEPPVHEDALRLLGTPEYMAPEQAAGEAVDARADLYALGAVLYELVTGRLPHVAPTALALIDLKLRWIPESPRERAPNRGIPRAFDRVIMRALARVPEERFGTAVEMRLALEAILAAPERARAIRRGISALAVVCIAGLIGVGVAMATEHGEIRSRAAAMVAPALRALHLVAPSGADQSEDPPVFVLYEAPDVAVRTKYAAPDRATSSRESPDAIAPKSQSPNQTTDAGDQRKSTNPSAQDETETSAEDASLAKAEAYARKGLDLQALNAYRALGKIRGNDPRVLRGWSTAAVKTKGWGEGLRVAVHWASVDPSPEAQMYLAKIQRAAGQRYGAVATLTRLIENHPEDSAARELLDQMSDRKLASR